MHAAIESWTIYEAIALEVPSELIREHDLACQEAGKIPRRRLISDRNGMNPRYPEYLASDRRVRTSRYAVENHLFTRLKSDLIATGRYGTPIAAPDVLPPTVWAHFWFRDWRKSTAFDRSTKTTIYDIRISKRVAAALDATSAVGMGEKTKRAKAVRKVQAKISEITACERWLVDWMRANRERRISSQRKWFGRAKEKWLTLSLRQFVGAWYNAVKKSRAPAWSAPGSPKQTDIMEVPKWPEALTACRL
ncbi:hypothetical protein JQ641_36985 [Bradyrhizobium sp. JYMT SZCCT0180]|nr:hypothetical protein [Bradyrhizobium sp. JYMT SZCCT0180]